MTARLRKVKVDSGLRAAKEGRMSQERVSPADCRTMQEVRHGVDRLDEQIVALLAERFRYMEAAARIKPDRGAVRDEWRKADVLEKVQATAERERAPAERIGALYEALVESSIAYEFGRWDETRG